MMIQSVWKNLTGLQSTILDSISYYHVEKKLIQTMRVLSVLPPHDGCVGESLDPVLGMCLFCSFLVASVSQRYKINLSLLKVLQSLLYLPEQEHCKNFCFPS